MLCCISVLQNWNNILDLSYYFCAVDTIVINPPIGTLASVLFASCMLMIELVWCSSALESVLHARGLGYRCHCSDCHEVLFLKKCTSLMRSCLKRMLFWGLMFNHCLIISNINWNFNFWNLIENMLRWPWLSRH